MADLLDSIVEKTKVWRGASKLAYAPSGTSFPGRIESLINPSTYALNQNWTVMGGTTPDGVTVTREFEAKGGVEVDQLGYDLFDGEPDKWMMSLAANLLHSDLTTLQVAWELGDMGALTSGTGPTDYGVDQNKVGLSAPTSLTKRRVAAIQENPEDGDLRAVVFRTAKISEEAAETVMAANDASAVPITFKCEADTSLSEDADPFGVIFEETTSS